MNKLDELITHFERFPGIGARQARRFAFHVLSLPEADKTNLAELISGISHNVANCAWCQRFFTPPQEHVTLCSLCDRSDRDESKLMIVERDQDVTVVERAGAYDGLYFVLGGTVPLLENKDHQPLRSGALKTHVNARKDALKEVILAFSINPDGENTARFVELTLAPLLKDSAARITHLGRGLSTGSELEYADPETIKNALKNRF